jgi:hypothetical protein
LFPWPLGASDPYDPKEWVKEFMFFGRSISPAFFSSQPPIAQRYTFMFFRACAVADTMKERCADILQEAKISQVNPSKVAVDELVLSYLMSGMTPSNADIITRRKLRTLNDINFIEHEIFDRNEALTKLHAQKGGIYPYYFFLLFMMIHQKLARSH